MKDLPLHERPRERLVQKGDEALSTSELLAIILGSGTKEKPVTQLAQEILAHFATLRKLKEATLDDLCQIKGIGFAKAIQLKAALSLATRIHREEIQTKYQVTTPEQAYLYLREYLAYEKREVFGVLLQDVRGCVIKWEMVSTGTLTQTLVHPREVFYPAIRNLAASLILAHNHPSGDPTPSEQDLIQTQRLIKLGSELGIPVLDHLIISSQSFISLKTNNLVIF